MRAWAPVSFMVGCFLSGGSRSECRAEKTPRRGEGWSARARRARRALRNYEDGGASAHRLASVPESDDRCKSLRRGRRQRRRRSNGRKPSALAAAAPTGARSPPRPVHQVARHPPWPELGVEAQQRLDLEVGIEPPDEPGLGARTRRPPAAEWVTVSSSMSPRQKAKFNDTTIACRAPSPTRRCRRSVARSPRSGRRRRVASRRARGRSRRGTARSAGTRTATPSASRATAIRQSASRPERSRSRAIENPRSGAPARPRSAMADAARRVGASGRARPRGGTRS